MAPEAAPIPADMMDEPGKKQAGSTTIIIDLTM
jgi:hypothetical protein